MSENVENVPTDSQKEDLMREFAGVTGEDASHSRQYLEANLWRLENALANYYDIRGTADLSSRPSNSNDSVRTQRPVLTETQRRGGGPMRGGQVRGVTTLSDLQRMEESSDEEETGQAFYAGGSEHSGQQVLGPRDPLGGRRNTDNVVSDMFRSVREYSVDPDERPRSGHRMAFSGVGYRLGDGEGPTEVAADGGGRSAQPSEVSLRFYRNGFTVNNGELRLYDSPEGQEFLNHIKRGDVPPELMPTAVGMEVSFNMEDRREVDYKPEKGAKSTPKFTGTGQTVGGSISADGSDDSIPDPATVDEGQPITSVQIRYEDGRRAVARFNHTHLVGHIRAFIAADRPEYTDRRYALAVPFPRRILTDNKQTIADAALLNAVVVQQLIN